MFRIDFLSGIRHTQKSCIGFIPDFPVKHSVFEVCHHCLTVIDPGIDAFFAETGRGIKVGSTYRFDIHIQTIAETEAEPGLDSSIQQAVHDFIEPGKIIFTRFCFRPLPAGLQTCPFYAGIPCKWQYFIEIIPVAVIQQFKTYAQRGVFDFFTGFERHIGNEFQFRGKSIVTGIEEHFLVFHHFFMPWIP